MRNKYQLLPSADGTKVNLTVFAESGERLATKDFDTVDAAVAEATAALAKDIGQLKDAAAAKANAQAGDKQ